MFRQHTFVLLASFFAMAGTSQSATFTITPTLVAAFDPVEFDTVPNVDPATYAGPPVILQVDFLLNYEGSEGTFGAIVFDIDLRNIAESAAIPGWQPYDPYCLGTCPIPPPLLFANNGDLGVPGDLKHIAVSIPSRLTTNPLTDPRLMIGQGRTFFGWPLDILGSLYLDWDGHTPAEINVVLREGGYRRPSDGLLFVDPNPTLIGNTLRIGPPPAAIPEPASIAVAGLATFVLGLVYRRQHSRANRSTHS